jgi:hypothetical protein
MRDGRAQYVGQLGRDLDVATGQRSAELTMLNILASVQAEFGELDQVRSFVQLSVFVHSTAEFAEHHLVADGASRLVSELYGAGSAHARYAVGMTSLPFGIATEIAAVAELR